MERNQYTHRQKQLQKENWGRHGYTLRRKPQNPFDERRRIGAIALIKEGDLNQQFLVNKVRDISSPILSETKDHYAWQQSRHQISLPVKYPKC